MSGSEKPPYTKATKLKKPNEKDVANYNLKENGVMQGPSSIS